jgi:hypothetical protein
MSDVCSVISRHFDGAKVSEINEGRFAQGVRDAGAGGSNPLTPTILFATPQIAPRPRRAAAKERLGGTGSALAAAMASEMRGCFASHTTE